MKRHVIEWSDPENYTFSADMASAFGKGANKRMRAHATYRSGKPARILFIVESQGSEVCRTASLPVAIAAYNDAD